MAKLMMDHDPRVARSKQRIVEATLALLGERGVGATTMEAISERSGVAKTTIYRHWDDKAGLVLDALATLLEEPADPDTGSLREDLHHLVKGLARALSQSRWAALLPSLIDEAERNPEFADLHRSFVGRRHRVVRDVILRGIGRGELPRGVDPDEVTDLLAGALFYRRLVAGAEVEEAFAGRLVDLVLNGYRSA